MSPRRIAKMLAMIGGVALLAIVLVTVAVVRRRSAAQNLETAAAILPGALLHAHNFHWTQMRGDQSQWVLKATDASYSNDKTSIVLSQAQLALTAHDGKRLVLTAPRARLTVNGNHVSRADLSGGLTVDYGDFVLLTPTAVFLPDDDHIEAPGTVTIDGPGLKVEAVGLSGHPKAQVFRLLKQVNTRLEPQPRVASAKPS